jgi:antitoxin YefM
MSLRRLRRRMTDTVFKEVKMLATNPTDARRNLTAFMDKVIDNSEALIIARSEGRDVVMISKDEYDNILENIHVLGNKSNREWLLLGKKQAESGNVREVSVE